MKHKIIGLGLAVVLLLSSPVFAGAPLDAVQANVNKVFEILRDPKLKPASAKELKMQKLRAIYSSMFDEIELAKRTLTRNWNKLNDTQRKEFVHLFEQVLEKAYIDRILDYSNEKVVYSREKEIAANQVEVQTKIITASKEVPIAYRMIQTSGTWKVYDVVIENVSLVSNYRTQFNDILAKNTPEQLLDILRKKVKAQ
jgi:phospholipid transport system substrate-binding protein